MLNKGLLLMMLVSILTGCGNNQVNDIVSNKSGAIQEVETSNEIAKSNHVAWIGLDNKDGSFHKIKINTPQLSKTFEWTNESNPSFFPAIEEIDINGDQVSELVLILTTATGTGVNLQELHILKQSDLSEIEYERPLDYVNANIKQSITKDNGEVFVHIEGADQVIDKTYKESDAGMWFDNVFFGSTITYEVKDGGITATLSGNVSPGESAVSAILEYDSTMKIKSMTLTEITS